MFSLEGHGAKLTYTSWKCQAKPSQRSLLGGGMIEIELGLWRCTG